MKTNPIHILLADDDSDDIINFQKALQHTDIAFTMTIAEDGNELMQILENQKGSLPDIIFLDINMPQKDGQECLEDIRRQAQFQRLRRPLPLSRLLHHVTK